MFSILRSMETKTCNKCKRSLAVSEFHFRYKAKGIRQAHCRLCQNSYTQNHYANNKQYYKDKSKLRDQENIEYVSKLKSKPCSDCKKKYHPCQMDFDHLYDKTRDISNAVRDGWAKCRLDAEISKCDLVCSNCHRLRTWKRKRDKS